MYFYKRPPSLSTPVVLSTQMKFTCLSITMLLFEYIIRSYFLWR